VYYRDASGQAVEFDPNYARTGIDLINFRAHLLNRAVTLGPPPYSHCP
jgi:hypothetical protein